MSVMKLSFCAISATIGVGLWSCHTPVSTDTAPSTRQATLAQVYYWRAKPEMLGAYRSYIRDVAPRIEEEHGSTARS